MSAIWLERFWDFRPKQAVRAALLRLELRGLCRGVQKPAPRGDKVQGSAKIPPDWLAWFLSFR